MAKRANPFVEDYVQQSKVHVGIKQFNNNEDRLKKVYEKTLELLFKGAKKPIVSENLDMLTEAPLGKDKMKQLFLGKDGSLLHEGTMVRSAPILHCGCGAKFDSSCSYCEKPLCQSCKHLCSNCDMMYCSHCSFIGSEGGEVCVTCYS